MNWYRVIGVVVVLVIIGLVAHSCSNPNNKKYQQAIAAWQDSTKKAVARVDSVEKVNARLVASSDLLQHQAADEHAQAQKALTAVRALKVATDKTIVDLMKDSAECKAVCAEWQLSALKEKDVADQEAQVIQQDQDIYQKQIAATVELTTGYNNRGAEIDTLKERLDAVPVYKPSKILGFIPTPSAKTSFIVGAVLATVTTIVVTHK